jgi:hypothetical protein
MQSNEEQWTATMAAEDLKRGVPRMAFRIKEAAEALGMSQDSFERYVEGHVGVMRLGTMKLVPLAELERFVEENACRAGGDW